MLDKKRPDAILITFEKDPSPRNVKPLAQHRTLYVLVLLPTTDLSAPLNPNHRSWKALVTYINISSGSPQCTITSWPPKNFHSWFTKTRSAQYNQHEQGCSSSTCERKPVSSSEQQRDWLEWLLAGAGGRWRETGFACCHYTTLYTLSYFVFSVFVLHYNTYTYFPISLLQSHSCISLQYIYIQCVCFFSLAPPP